MTIQLEAEELSMYDVVQMWQELADTVHYADDWDDPILYPEGPEGTETMDEDVEKYDTKSLAVKPGKKDNWLEAQGDTLDPFIRAIANALMREKGMPRSQAIAIAIGTCKRWARGGGDVSAKTRLKAVKAIAKWEKSKAKSKAKRSR